MGLLNEDKQNLHQILSKGLIKNVRNLLFLSTFIYQFKMYAKWYFKARGYLKDS